MERSEAKFVAFARARVRFVRFELPAKKFQSI